MDDTPLEDGPRLITIYCTYLQVGEPTNSGLGYSLLFLCDDSWNATGPKYVFKIVETRPHEFVMEGNQDQSRISQNPPVSIMSVHLDGNICKNNSGSCPGLLMTHICWRKFEIKCEEDILNTAPLCRQDYTNCTTKQDVRDSGWGALDGIISYRNNKSRDSSVTPLSSRGNASTNELSLRRHCPNRSLKR